MSKFLGRTAPYTEAEAPRLKLAKYLLDFPVPAATDWVDDLSATGWPMYLNDQLGDCTIAAIGHMIEAWTRYGQGKEVLVKDAQVLAAYKAISGYNGDPDTDDGCNMQDVLKYMQKIGIGGYKVAAYASLDHTNLTQMHAAMYLTGHVYIGVNLPKSAEGQFDAGQPWDVTADDGGILGGHAVTLGYAGPSALWEVITWGQVQKVTTAWIAKYVEEAWVAFSPTWIKGTSAGDSLDLATLTSDYKSLTGRSLSLTKESLLDRVKQRAGKTRPGWK
jgi:hypothetical protein